MGVECVGVPPMTPGSKLLALKMRELDAGALTVRVVSAAADIRCDAAVWVLMREPLVIRQEPRRGDAMDSRADARRP